MADQPIIVSAMVFTSNEEHAAKAAEVFGRVAVGLVLEGIDVSVRLSIDRDDENDEEEVGPTDGG